MVKARRGRGEGSIFQRKDGVWVGRLSLGYDLTGKRVRHTVYGKTKREVQQKLLQLQQDALRGVPVKPEKMTVAQHFEDWLRTKRPPHVRSATALKYRRLCKDHILPALGGIPLKDLTYVQINAFYERLDQSGLSRSTVASIAAVLRMGLEDAVRKGLIPKNPAKLASSRTPGHKEARCMTPDELDRFLEAAKGERMEDAFILALHTGLRPGEWLGLSWSAVDLENGKLTVKQALHEEDGKLFLGEVKTKAARRTITLPPTAVRALRRQRKRQIEEQLAAGGTWKNEWNLVFTDRKGGPLRRTNVDGRDLRRVLNKAALVAVARRTGFSLKELLSVNAKLSLTRPLQAGQEVRLPDGKTAVIRREDLLSGVTLHTFRHTHASILIFAGEDIKNISSRLGHENITTTLQTYGHLMPGQDERAAIRVEAFFSSLPSKPS